MSKHYRFEFKYEMSSGTAAWVEEEIKKFGMQPDANISSGDHSYYVTSLYFDSYDFSDYWDKAGGFLERKKIRARIYEPFLDKSEKIWLEIKKKHGCKNSKTRFQIDREDWECFIKCGPSALLSINSENMNRKARDAIFYAIAKSGAKPRVLVRYKRKAFVNDSLNLRITFDSELEACKKNNLGYNSFTIPVNKGGIIMEIKYDYLTPFWLEQVIKKFDLKMDAFSKYAHSIEAVHRYNSLLR